MNDIQLDEKQKEIVLRILRGQNVSEVYVFGSRAKFKAKPLSDLDLCIRAPMDKRSIRKLQDGFEESDLPFKVDIILWSEISDEFKKNIEPDLKNIFLT